MNKVFEFKGSPVTFKKENDVMVNATEMAKPFGKRPNDWMLLPSTKEFLEALAITRKSGNSDYQAVITKAGTPQFGGGTWLTEDAALEFARWLSPAFAIWLRDNIDNLKSGQQKSAIADNQIVGTTKVFDYMGTDVTFKVGDKLYVDATEIGKRFNKKPGDWLKTKYVQEYLHEYSASKKIVPTDLVIVRNGGTNFGTWLYEDIALLYAQWLSPAFAIWCNDRIKELLTTGSVSIGKPSYQIEDPIARAEAWIAEKKAMLALENKVKEDAPKVEYHDEVLSAVNGMTVTDIAKELGMSPKGLNLKLALKHIQYKQGRSWKLYAEYQDKGYMTVRTTVRELKNGEKMTFHDSLWTEEGRKFIHQLLGK